jgi:hypothetical protein
MLARNVASLGNKAPAALSAREVLIGHGLSTEVGRTILPGAFSDFPDGGEQVGGIGKVCDLHNPGNSDKLRKTEETLSDVRQSGGPIRGAEKRRPEYRAWIGIKQRCYNPRHPRYRDYGGRGILVCERWRLSFAAFLNDVGLKPLPESTIERIDNNGPYSPENCCWATDHDQSRNRRSNIILTHNGPPLCLNDWAARVGIGRMTLTQRLRRGWSVSEALTTAVQRRLKC